VISFSPSNTSRVPRSQTVEDHEGSPQLPRLIIEIPFEGKPVVMCDCLHEIDRMRLQEWLVASHPPVVTLLGIVEKQARCVG